jgi:hypothetical protein
MLCFFVISIDVPENMKLVTKVERHLNSLLGLRAAAKYDDHLAEVGLNAPDIPRAFAKLTSWFIEYMANI